MVLWKVTDLEMRSYDILSQLCHTVGLEPQEKAGQEEQAGVQKKEAELRYLSSRWPFTGLPQRRGAQPSGAVEAVR